jgi:serine/threonine protein kinase
MSPEQASGLPVDARSDLFSLGTLLYECLAGRPAFTGATSLAIGAQVIHVDPPPPSPSQFRPSVPPELDCITLKTLAKKPEARYQSAGELIKDLRDMCPLLSTEHRMPVPTVSWRNARLRTKLAATSFWRSGALNPLAFVQLVLALLILWLFPRMGAVVLHLPTAKLHRADAEAVRAATSYPANRGTEHVIKLDDDLTR